MSRGGSPGLIPSSVCGSPKTIMPKRSKASEVPAAMRVKIDVYSAMTVLDPPVPLLGPYLEHRLTRFEEGGKTGYRGRQEDQCMWDFDIKGRMGVPTGLIPRVKRVLAEHGYDVTLTDHRAFTGRFTIDDEFLGLTAGDDRRLLDAVRQEPLGQIEVENFKDMIGVMRLIVSMYPKAHVLMPVATKALARKICFKLNETAVDFQARLFGGQWPQKPPRCMVCTLRPLLSGRMEEWDIILLPDPLGAVASWGVEGLSQFMRKTGWESHRMYAFLLPGIRLGRRDRIRLEAMSGEVIYYLAPQRAGVRVLWLPTPGCKAVTEGCSALAFKRWAYWRNSRRNDFIAAVAKAFVNGDNDRLRSYGVPFRNGKPVLRHAKHPRIVVLVASTQQAQELAQRLPGWNVMDAVPKKSTEDDAAGGDTPSLGTIITETRASKDGLYADILIRAGGSSGILCFKDFPPQLTDKEKRDAIVIDFTDTFDERAIEDANRRRREYDLAGWECSADPPEMVSSASKE